MAALSDGKNLLDAAVDIGLLMGLYQGCLGRHKLHMVYMWSTIYGRGENKERERWPAVFIANTVSYVTVTWFKILT